MFFHVDQFDKLITWLFWTLMHPLRIFVFCVFRDEKGWISVINVPFLKMEYGRRATAGFEFQVELRCHDFSLATVIAVCAG